MQTFRELRERDCYYVDKTAYIERLLDEGKHYFLSRPRRFGKSLFLDTLKELFEGNQALFAGLHIHERYDWSVHHPVVRLSFGGGNFTEPGLLEANVMEQLGAAERRTGVVSEYRTAAGRFAYLLEALHAQTGQRVAVLVDEYDKPILDALETPEIARANRDYLRGLYGVIKDSDAHVRFTFLTGVSKFSKVNLFSQLNNLTDITLDPVYSSICGYTEGDLDTLFERRVASVSLDRTVSTEELLSAFDVGGRTAAEHIGTEALLFQTGYLTIKGEEDLGGRALYRLGYPNREVRQSLNEHLLRHLVQDAERQTSNSMRLARLLAAHDCAGLAELFHAFFASIPYEWYTNNDIANYEGYYASVFYSYFAALGYEITVEESTVEESSSHGRLDMAVRTGGHVYLFEFKVVEMAPPGSALAQLQDRDYAARYRGRGEPIHLIGVEFSRQTRNVTAFEVADG